MTPQTPAGPSSLLLLLLDSRSPAGAHGHSGGLEAAVTAGLVRTTADLRGFLAGRLATSGRVGAAFAAAGCRAWWAGADAGHWARLDAELSARTPAEPLRAASRALGSGLRRLVQATVPTADLRTPWALVPGPAPHHPLVLGAACALAGADPEVAARAYALGLTTGAASAAVRLRGLDPYAVHAVVAALAGPIEALAAELAAIEDVDDLPAECAPALELLADVHARAEVRLFAS